jgi:hypothetical protein
VAFHTYRRAFAADQKEAIILAVNGMAVLTVFPDRLVLDLAQRNRIVTFQAKLVSFGGRREDVLAANRLMAGIAFVLGRWSVSEAELLEIAVTVGRNASRAYVKSAQLFARVFLLGGLLSRRRLSPSSESQKTAESNGENGEK